MSRGVLDVAREASSLAAVVVLLVAMLQCSKRSVEDRPPHQAGERAGCDQRDHRAHRELAALRECLDDRHTYAWLLIVGGIVLAAAGLEELVLHPDDPSDRAFRWMFIGGTVLTMAGIGSAILRAFTRVAIERSVAAVTLIAIGLVGDSLDGLALVVAVDLVLLTMLVAEHLRVEWRYRDEPQPSRA